MKYLLSLLLLGGCAYSPHELREVGNRFEYQGALPPAEAANCMARNTETFDYVPGMRYHAEVRDGGSGALEIVVRPANSAIITALVARRNGGSTITMWVLRNTPILEDLAAHMAKGC